MLTASAVSVSQGGALAVSEVSLAVAPGELLVLAGPNAAGKSTLLDVLAGTLAPRPGAVSLDGIALAEWSPRALARRRAVLPQYDALSFPFRVEEVVALGLMPHARLGESGRAVGESLARAGVVHLLGRRYTELSGGERRRVQLARVLAQVGAAPTAKPSYLLLDEPTAALDLAYQHSVMGCLRALAEEGLGVLAVVHDLSLAARYAHRLALMGGGRLHRCGPVDEVLQSPSLEAVYGVGVEVWRRPGRPPVVVAHPDHE